MEITVQEFPQVELLAVQGRVDSIEAPRLATALKAASGRGKHMLVIDMSQLEYISSAGFRALAEAQRNSKRHTPGEVVLTQVPDRIREVLEIVGFAEYFNIIDPLPSALTYAENLAAGVSPADAPPASSEK